MSDIMQAVVVMGKGMIGIFTALAIVYLFTTILIKIFPKDKELVDSDV